MFKQFAYQGNYSYLSFLDRIVTEYNNTKHRTTKLKPSEINESNEKSVFDRVFNYRKIAKAPKFMVGDAVRISKVVRVFQKSYHANWSAEIYTIHQIKNTAPITYILKDYDNEIIKGAFYEQELQPVKYSDGYLIEKILKRGPKQSLVKWWNISEPTYEPNDMLY